MDNLTKLRYWTFKILPLVYDDSLSYYEVLTKVTNKVNELVDSNNTMPQAITDEITKQLDESYATNINNKIDSAVNTVTENANNQIDKLANEVYAKFISAIATDEGTNTFTKDAKSGGELIFLNNTLYKVTAVMQAGTNYIIGTNIIPVDISEELKTIKETYISTNNEHWNDRSTNNYDTGTYLYWKDVLYIATKDIKINDILYTDSDNQNLKQVTLASEITNIQKQIYKNDNDIDNLQKNLAQETSRATNRENIIDGRISNIVAQSGNDNTEIVDARIGYDGTTYDTLGTAIRTQVNDIKEDLDLLVKIKNFNVETAKQNTDYNYSLLVGDMIEITNKTDGNITVILLWNNSVIDTATDFLSKDQSITYTAKSASDKIRFWSSGTGYVKVENLNTFSRKTTTQVNDIKEDLTSKAILGGVHVYNESSSTNYNDLNAITTNRIILFTNRNTYALANAPTASDGIFYSIARTSKKSTEQDAVIQYYAIGPIGGSDTNRIYYRMKWSTKWAKWSYIIVSNGTERDDTYASIAQFTKIGVIGDSYASGEIVLPPDYNFIDYYSLSWGQCIARRNGITCTNYSSGGLSTRTWLSAEKGKTLLDSSEPDKLYLLALGINDANKLGLQYLGNINDIKSDYTQNADTFYGNYGKIISIIMAKSSKAKIIMLDLANDDNSSLLNSYNSAIKEIAEHFGIPYIHENDDNFFNSAFYKDKSYGHPTATTYSGMALAIERLFSKCCVNNVTYFRDYVG